MSRYDPSNDINQALGKVSGVELFAKWGRNSVISTATTPEDIWDGGGLYTGFNTILGAGGAEKMTIVSDDAADAAAGTGARTVEVSNLLDDDGNRMPNKIVTLNGTTPVEIDATQTYARALRIKVLTSGSNGANEGNLTLAHATTGANIFAVMPIGENQTLVGAYTVPVGYCLLIDKFYVSANISSGGAQNATGRLLVRPFGEVFQNKLPIEVSANKDFNPIGDSYFYKVDAKADIKLNVKTVSSNNTIMTGAFGGVLVKV